MTNISKVSDKKSVYIIALVIWIFIVLVGYFIIRHASSLLISESTRKPIDDFFAIGVSIADNHAIKAQNVFDNRSALKQIINDVVKHEGVTFACILDVNDELIAFDEDNAIFDKSPVTKPIGNIGIMKYGKNNEKIVVNFFSDIEKNGKKLGKLYVTVTPSMSAGTHETGSSTFIIAEWCVISLLLLILTILILNNRLGRGIKFSKKGPEEIEKPIECGLENKSVMFFKYMLLEAALQKMCDWKMPDESGKTEAGTDGEKFIGSYELKRMIHRGKLFEFYLAGTPYEDSDSTKYALKKIRDDRTHIRELVESFKEEANLSLLMDNPNIVRSVDYQKKHHALVVEYIEGKNLAEIMANEEMRLPIDGALHVILQICQALKYAYGFKGNQTGESPILSHGNLKPENIIVSFEGDIKLTDFGISKLIYEDYSDKAGCAHVALENAVDQAISRIHSEGRTIFKTMGSTDEQLSNEIFAMGISFWETLAGKRLVQTKSDMNDLKKKIPSLKKHSSEIPDELDRIVMKCLEKNKERRYRNMSDIIQDMVQLGHSQVVRYDMSDYSYLAPEQIRGEKSDHRSDIYLIGVLAYEMISGKRYFSIRNDMEIINSFNDRVARFAYLKEKPDKNVMRLRYLMSDASDELGELIEKLDGTIMKCLETDPDERYQRIDELYTDVDLLTRDRREFGKSDVAAFMKHRFPEKNLR